MKKSWSKRFTALLSAVLATVCLFLIWTNLYYYSQVRSTIESENTNAAKGWSTTVTNRLNSLHEHIYDLMLSIYNDTQQLRSGTPMMKIQVQRACLDTMTDKLIINSDATCFFVRDDESKLFLFSFKYGIPNQEASALKKFARSYPISSAVALNSARWRIEEINGEAYFVQMVSIGKYLAGCASRLSNYDIRNNYSVLGSGYSCIADFDGKLYLCSGEDWRQELHFREDAPYFFDGRTAVSADLAVVNTKIILAVESVYPGSNILALLLASGICLLLMLYLFFFLHRNVVRPTQILLKANQSVAEGNIDFRITQTPSSSEFSELFDSFNHMTDQIQNLRIASYDHMLQEQDNRLRMLRAQVKPHFYLNAITTINNMTYQGKPENTRTYIAVLARYLRYMMNTQSEWTTVGEELSHIRNYLKMQDYRFPDSIREEIICSPEVENVRVPLLAIFTLVENSLKHAMTLYEPLNVKLTVEKHTTSNFTGIRIIEEDSGDGFPQQVLDAGQEPPVMTKEHLGLSNLRYTLNLIYHRDDLLRLSNREGGGAHVEIWIPEEDNHEAAHM